MANYSTPLFFQSVSLSLDSLGVPDSIFVELKGVDAESVVEIDGISWGIQSATKADLSDFDFGALFVIRNDIFDPAFVYSNANVHRAKDVVFEDTIHREFKYRDRDFRNPLKMSGYANYLIIMNAPTAITRPDEPFTGILTVRGRLVTECPRRRQIS